MQVCYLHGFNSSHRSFNYVQHKLPSHDIIPITYNSHQSVSDTLEEVKKQLPPPPFSLVGHSLGGIIAVLLGQQVAGVRSIVGISTPFGGSKAAVALRWLPGYPKVFHDITPSCEVITKVTSTKLKIPTLSIISIGGSLPTTQESNDSVVTVASQRALPYGKKVEVKANHFEVLMHEKTLALLEDFLFEREV